MQEWYYASALWGVRPETPAECAERAWRFFQALRQLDASWEQWCRAGRRLRGAPGIPVDVENRQELEELFRRGRNRTDLGKKEIEDLGFYLHVWTPLRSERTRVDIHCGLYAPSGCNSCDTELPVEGEVVERMASAAALTRVLMGMTMAWDSEWGVANSNKLVQLIPRRNKGEYPVGWVMYCSDRQGRVPPLPAPVRIERVLDKGTLITLTDERFTATNPEHVARAVRVHELLQRAGVLQVREEEPSPNP